MTTLTRRWRYHVLRSEGPIDAEHLDALGNKGWELVAAVPDADSGTVSLIFKRPAPDFRTQITLDQRAAVAGAAETSR
jgi:hypothetical protein